MKKTTPILVTGSHRSGTTWAGMMLAAAPQVSYIHEPFNLDIRLGINPTPPQHWFEFICEENAGNYRKVLDDIFSYKYPLISNIKKVKSFMELSAIVRDQILSVLHRINGDRPVVKDPIAIFSADWLCRTFNMNVLVMIRHPAAFCSSIKIKNWHFGFRHFLAQPLLMEKYLERFEKEIHERAESPQDIIDQGILLWNCIHHTINIYRKNHPEWLFVRHEDLSRDPARQFQMIFEKFDLEFTDRVRKRILASTGAHNPVEQQTGNEFLRDSKKNIYNWKNRLSREEIELIKERTSEIAGLFYSENEW